MRENWRQIDMAIRENDPLCRGVVLLGLSASEEDVIASFAVAAPFSYRQGIRSRPHHLSRRGTRVLQNRIDDQGAIESLARKFSVLVQAWRRFASGAQADDVRLARLSSLLIRPQARQIRADASSR